MGRKGDRSDVGVDGEGRGEEEHSDVVDQSSAVVVGVSSESRNGSLLSGALVNSNVVSTSDGSDATVVVTVGGGDTLRDKSAEGATAEVGTTSLEGENVWLRVGLDNATANDDGNGGEGIGGGEDSGGELKIYHVKFLDVLFEDSLLKLKIKSTHLHLVSKDMLAKAK